MAESLKEKTKKGLFWKLFDQTANQGIQFIVGIIMARLLSPEDFGITALPTVFISIAGILREGGFSVALIRKPDLTDKDLSTSFYYSLGVGVLMYICLFIGAPYIADFYNTPILTKLVRVTALTFLWAPLSTPQYVILNRKLDFKTTARISVINKFVAGIISVIAAYNGFGLWALVIYGLLTSLIGLIQIWFVVKWIPKSGFNKDSFKYLWNYGNKLIGAKLIDVGYSNITPLVVGKVYSTEMLGFYNRANGYVNLPANQLGNLLMSVTLPVLSKLQGDLEALKRNYRKMISVAAFISFPIFMILCALSKPFIILLVTEKWAASIILLQILCFAKMWWPIHSINTNFLQVIGRSDLYLKVEIVKKIFMFVALCASLPFGLKIFCVGVIIQNLLALCINTYYTGKIIKYNLFDQIKDMLPSIAASAAVLIIVNILLNFIDSLMIQLVAGILIGGGLYIGIAYFFKFKAFYEFKSLMHKTK